MRVVASFVVLLGIAACGGASESNLFDPAPNTITSSSSSSGGPSSTSSSSGASTSSSSSSSGSSSSSSSSSGNPPDVDSGIGDPKRCNVSTPSCAADEYCQAVECKNQGLCVRRPTEETLDINPVCGCDGVTYWNASIAGIRGANFSKAGECGDASRTCTKNDGCTGDSKCNLEGPVCPIGEAKGVCWMLPKSCEGTNSKLVRRCNNFSCLSFCSAVRNEAVFTPGNGCL